MYEVRKTVRSDSEMAGFASWSVELSTTIDSIGCGIDVAVVATGRDISTRAAVSRLLQ